MAHGPTPFQVRFKQSVIFARERSLVSAFNGSDDRLDISYDHERANIVLSIESKELEACIEIGRRDEQYDSVMAMVAVKSSNGIKSDFVSSWYKDIARKVDRGCCYVNRTCFSFYDIVESDSDSSWGALAALDVVMRSIIELKVACNDFRASSKTFLLSMGRTCVPLHLTQSIFELVYGGGRQDVTSQAIKCLFECCPDSSMVSRRLF